MLSRFFTCRKMICLLPLMIGLVACSLSPVVAPAPQQESPTALAALPSFTPSASPTAAPAPTFTLMPTFTATPPPTSTSTSSPSITPTITLSPTSPGSPTPTLPSPTPTFDFPDVTVLMQANCRYGPGKAYLYSHGLYEGDRGEIHGRNYAATWLWIKPENLERHCWVAASVVEIQGDPLTVSVVNPPLPWANNLYSAPKNVKAIREGNKVTVTWKRVNMTEDDDRGYLLEVYVCQGGALVWMAVRTDNTFYEFTDEPGCKTASSGLLYTVEKHGYTMPVKIPWPERG